jgi:IrrE N-terminal-like domain
VPLRFDPRPVAERIWREVGYRPAFPRDIVQPIMDTFDVAVILLPQLSIASLNAWLWERGRAPLGRHANRALRGCLLARKGRALIFLDGSLTAEERRFALSHELAHFFAHYLEPRQRATMRFGPQILPVIDGERPATTTEKLAGILREVPIGPFEDFLARDSGGRPSGVILDIETEADLIALELLAPCNEVLRLAKPGPGLASILAARFGLPAWAAAEWGRFITELCPRSDPVILGIERAIKNKV